MSYAAVVFLKVICESIFLLLLVDKNRRTAEKEVLQPLFVYVRLYVLRKHQRSIFFSLDILISQYCDWNNMLLWSMKSKPGFCSFENRMKYWLVNNFNFPIQFLIFSNQCWKCLDNSYSKCFGLRSGHAQCDYNLGSIEFSTLSLSHLLVWAMV